MGEGGEGDDEEAWLEPNVVTDPSRDEWGAMRRGDEDDEEELQLGVGREGGAYQGDYVYIYVYSSCL